MNIEKKLAVLSILAAVTSPSVFAMLGSDGQDPTSNTTVRSVPLSLYGPATIVNKQKPTATAAPEIADEKEAPEAAPKVKTADENQKLLEEANKEVKNLGALLRQAEDQASKNETALMQLVPQLAAAREEAANAQEEAAKSKEVAQGWSDLWEQVKTMKNKRISYKQKVIAVFDLLSKHYEEEEEEVERE